MSLYDYERSIEVVAKGYPFYALVMAAMKVADSDNIEKLMLIFPRTYYELQERSHFPGGLVSEERFRRGTQIIYVPQHAGIDLNHKDVEAGFVTSTRRNNEGKCIVFCRYWSKSYPTELRTRANSEATPAGRLIEKDTRPQEEIMHWLEIIDSEKAGQ